MITPSSVPFEVRSRIRHRAAAVRGVAIVALCALMSAGFIAEVWSPPASHGTPAAQGT